MALFTVKLIKEVVVEYVVDAVNEDHAVDDAKDERHLIKSVGEDYLPDSTLDPVVSVEPYMRKGEVKHFVAIVDIYEIDIHHFDTKKEAQSFFKEACYPIFSDDYIQRELVIKSNGGECCILESDHPDDPDVFDFSIEWVSIVNDVVYDTILALEEVTI